MATTTLTPSVASRGGVRLFGRQRYTHDLLALLVILCATTAGLILGYVRATDFELGIAGRYNAPHLRNFHEPETVAGQEAPSYRWTQDRSAIVAPALGRGLWETSLILSSPAPAGEPKQALLDIGTDQVVVQLGQAPRRFHLLTPSGGDIDITINAPAAQYGQDPRALGVVFFGAAFHPITTAIAPPVLLLFYSVLVATLAYTTLRLIGLQPSLAVLAPLLGLMLLSWGIATNRAPLGLLAPRLVILAAVGLPAVWILRWAWNRLLALGGLEAEAWLLPLLLVIFYLGFWIKATGLLYPYTHVIDVAWHMQRTREILGGRLVELYRPGAFSESVMPVQEWGQNRPVIPYSPFFHIFAASFALLPWPLETTANIFSVFFDTNRVILIGVLGLALGLRSRGALLAALLYATTPFTFLLHSWGNIPTTFGIWWTLLTTVLLVLTFGRWHERRIFVLLALSLLTTFLIYTVMAVFMGLFLVLFSAALALFGRRLADRQARWLLAVTAVAFTLSLVVYYGQYIPAMIERTLPYVTRTVVQGEANAGQTLTHEPFWIYIGLYGGRLGYTILPVRYGVWIPLLLGLPGLWLLRKQRLALIVLSTWFVVALFFLLLGNRVSMVDKHVFYVTPALVICAAAIFERGWPRGRVVQGVILGIMALTFVAALDLWIWRLQTVG